jgi:hypothetical protein
MLPPRGVPCSACVYFPFSSSPAFSPVEADVVECAREVLEAATADLDPQHVSATLAGGDAVPRSVPLRPQGRG